MSEDYMSDEERADIEAQALALLEEAGALVTDEVARQRIGLEARPFSVKDMAPAIIQNPETEHEMRQAAIGMKAAGYNLPVHLSLAVADFSGDDSGYKMSEDGDLGYDDSSMSGSNGFGGQW